MVAAAGLVWFNTKTYNVCCFKFCFGIFILMKSVAVIPQQCRKGNNPIHMQRVQEHIHQEKLIGKSFRKYAAYTETHIDTERKTESWWKGKDCHQMRNWKTEVGKWEYKSRSRVEAISCWPKYCHYAALIHPQSTSIMYSGLTGSVERNSIHGLAIQCWIMHVCTSSPNKNYTAIWQDIGSSIWMQTLWS